MPKSKKQRLQQGAEAAPSVQQTRVATSATRVTGGTLTNTNLAIQTGASTIDLDSSVYYNMSDPDITVAQMMEADRKRKELLKKRDAQLNVMTPVVLLDRLADQRTLAQRTFDLLERNRKRRIVQGRANDPQDPEEEGIIR